MIRLLLRRLLSGIVVLWIISVAVFVLFFIAPHNVARALAGRQATAQTVADVARRLGLNRPILDQYGSFLGNLLHGNLGYSYYNSEPVTSLIGSRIGVTISLTLGGAVLWLVIGITTGVLAATHPRSLIDKGATFFAVFFYSMPTFLLGLILLYFLFFQLHLAGIPIFPGSGYVSIGTSPWGWAQHLILPWIAVALTTAATYTRLTRAGMLEILGEDYIRTARAKGVSERRVTYRHALRAALTSVVTQLGIDVGVLLGGAVVTENIFGLPGLGQLAIQSVTQQDLPVIIGIVMLAAAFVVVCNFAVDMFYAVLDPRVRAH
ncbi:MAG TPA: ABC transporter permease [Streptosporangiaceae bacterium]|jgi:peptide/nickel transport system permease protein|nr:ABC transporter permease [Streptosporangiaceae bacterium]